MRYNIAMDKTQLNFFNTLDEMEKPNSCFMTADFTSPEFRIKLEYTRRDFIFDIKKILSGCSIEQQEKLRHQHNFAVIHKDTFDTIEGYPGVCQNGNEELNDKISRFFNNNRVLPSSYSNDKLCEFLNTITKALPEFLLLINKIQHHTHSYSVDVHTLNVLQGVMKDSRYSNLSNSDKRALQIAVLLHDLTKKEGEIDKSHPACAAKDAEIILRRFDIPEPVKQQTCLLIRHHDWLERYNKGITSPNEFASILKDGNNFLMECIIAASDLKAVQRDGMFYEKYKDVLRLGEQQIYAAIHSGINVA